MQIQQTSQGIYRQIADFGIEQILAGAWSDGEKIPSVRQLAAEVGVNPNTVMNAYDYLKELNIIETRRGLGFFVAATGQKAALALRRSVFIKEELPRIRRTLNLLGISTTDLTKMLSANPQTDN